MSDKNEEHESEDRGQYHFEGGVPVFDHEAERKERERNARDKEQGEYNRKQISIQIGLLVSQIGLVIFGIIGTAISTYQANTARISADASAIRPNWLVTLLNRAAANLSELLDS